MNWASINISDALTSPRPVLDLVLPGLPVATVGNLVAPGATGKTQFLLQLAVCRCLGLPSLGGLFPEAAPEHVLFLAAEEQEIIMRQRLHDIVDWLIGGDLFPTKTRASVINELQHRLKLFPLSGNDVRLIDDGYDTQVMKKISELGEDCRLIIADPLRRLHDGEENDSSAMTQLVQSLERIAMQTNAAVLVAHHTSKAATFNGQNDSQQAARGSSALTDGVRWQANLSTMSEKQAQAQNIPVEDARLYVNFSVSKSNYAAPQAPVWLRRLPGGVLTKVQIPKVSSSRRAVQYD